MYSISKRILVTLWIMSCILFLQPTANAYNETDSNFLVITDIHLNKTTSHRMDIAPTERDRANDLDNTTFDTLLTMVQSSIQNGTIPTPKFILLLGDVAQHDPESTSNTADDAQAVFQKVKQAFPSIPLLYIFGNNDSLDIHYGPFYADTPVGVWHSVYDVAKDSGWNDGFLSTGISCQNTTKTYPCLITEDAKLGHYSAYLQKNLRLIGINSIVFSKDRQHLTETDAQTELNWVTEQLQTAQQKQESVLLATHIPLGLKMEDNNLQWTADDHAKFLQLISSYKNNIIGVLVAHTHMEELKVIRTDQQHNIIVMLNSPSLCTYSANAPAVKTYYYRQNNTTWELTDTSTFYISQTSNGLLLQKLFDYNAYYCVKSSQHITDCLSRITLSKMNTYYTAGNNNYRPTLLYPDALYIDLPASAGQGDSSNNFATIAAVAAVAVGATVLTASQMAKKKGKNIKN